MFNMEGNVFSHKNTIIKNTRIKTSYLPNVDYKYVNLPNVG